MNRENATQSGLPSAEAVLRIGPAGWSYKDWEGLVYPPGVDQLHYLSRYFDAIEINNTFYRPVTPQVASSWIRRTTANGRFKFTVKLWRQATHREKSIEPAELRQWKEGVLPLLESSRLGAVLVQFPWSFKNCDRERDFLTRLVQELREFPLVVEFRHASWNDEGVYDLLQRLEVGFCNVDQPVIGKSLRLQSKVTSRIAYLRCHGRNYRNWFRAEAGRDERYDYLYRPQELEEQAGVVRALEQQAQEVYVIYNNHFRGQAVINALQLRRALEEHSPAVPEPLLKLHPLI